MNEEQIINYIKKDIEETSKQIENGELMFIEDNEKIRIAVLQSLLELYNKEKEKNFKRSNMLISLKAENTKLKDKCKELNFKYTAQWVDDNFISKDKIKEKIKELEKEQNKYIGYKGLEFSRTGLINVQIQKLQELLLEGE